MANRFERRGSRRTTVAELDCDPLVAGPGGAIVVDARARLETPPRKRPYAAIGR